MTRAVILLGRRGGPRLPLGSIGEVDMKISRSLLTLILATCAVAAFADKDVEEVSYKEMINLNRANVNKIARGMTKDEVVHIMGNLRSKVKNGPVNNPWKIEIFGDMEIFHYITVRHPRGCPAGC